eukprot:7578850-Alexandrium_andersonii.AAC.1
MARTVLGCSMPMTLIAAPRRTRSARGHGSAGSCDHQRTVPAAKARPAQSRNMSAMAMPPTSEHTSTHGQALVREACAAWVGDELDDVGGGVLFGRESLRCLVPEEAAALAQVGVVELGAEGLGDLAPASIVVELRALREDLAQHCALLRVGRGEGQRDEVLGHALGGVAHEATMGGPARAVGGMQHRGTWAGDGRGANAPVGGGARGGTVGALVGAAELGHGGERRARWVCPGDVRGHAGGALGGVRALLEVRRVVEAGHCSARRHRSSGRGCLRNHLEGLLEDLAAHLLALEGHPQAAVRAVIASAARGGGAVLGLLRRGRRGRALSRLGG